MRLRKLHGAQCRRDRKARGADRGEQSADKTNRAGPNNSDECELWTHGEVEYEVALRRAAGADGIAVEEHPSERRPDDTAKRGKQQ